MRTKEEWETWYVQSNPWGTIGSDKDIVRTDLLLDRLRYARFVNILDLGCGEGQQTNALSKLAENTIGIDIAGNAIERAQSQFPHIRFQQGELLDVIKDTQIAQTPFDFISLSEVLYYFQTDEERHAALSGLARIGAPACLYYFSVIVTGASKYRRYFTHDEFVEMLSEHFQVIDCFASVADLSRLLRILRLLIPSRSMRLELLRAWTATRKPDACRHAGYFAVKRATQQRVESQSAVSAECDVHGLRGVGAR
jgi:SAM-dependent methyltransferase